MLTGMYKDGMYKDSMYKDSDWVFLEHFYNLVQEITNN